MAGTALAIFQGELQPLMPNFEQALEGYMTPARLIRTAIMAAERNEMLLTANRQSFFNTIMSSAVLGLEMDGITGQAFPIPFAGKVQLVIGYKGYNTLGARSKLTITGDCVFEGDTFDLDKGEGWVKHKPRLSGDRGRFIGTWAKAAAFDRPAIVEYLSAGDVAKIKEKSPGAKKKDSPWNDPNIGFFAMASKSSKRRLARSLPLNLIQLAAVMEEAHEERGAVSYITPDRTVTVETVGETVQGEAQTPGIAALTAKPDKLLVEAQEKALEGSVAMNGWWEKLTADARLHLKPNLPDLRERAQDPTGYLQREGHEAADGGREVLDQWLARLPDAWREKMEPYYRETLLPKAAQA